MFRCQYLSTTDGVASHAFNGLTAMYYLLEQKHHAKRLKKAESSKTQIRQNSSNLSKPETGSDTNENARKDSNAYYPQQQQQQQQHAPLKLMTIDTLAPPGSSSGNNSSREPKDVAVVEKNIPIKTFVPITPYLQAPALLQQQQQHLQQQQHQRQYNSNMPSLDLYLKNGMDMQIGNNNNNNNNNNGVGSGKSGAASPQITSTGKSGVAIPPLNLRGKQGGNISNVTSAAVAAATGGTYLGNNVNNKVYISQTSRQPDQQNNALGIAENSSNTAEHPYSARAALPSG